MNKSVTFKGPLGCGLFVVLLVAMFFIGGTLTNYVLSSLTGHPTNMLAAGIIALGVLWISSLLRLPWVILLAALVCFILRTAGVHAPFFHV